MSYTPDRDFDHFDLAFTADRLTAGPEKQRQTGMDQGVGPFRGGSFLPAFRTFPAGDPVRHSNKRTPAHIS